MVLIAEWTLEVVYILIKLLVQKFINSKYRIESFEGAEVNTKLS